MSATNRGANRRPNDFYQTPDYTIESLFKVLDFNNIKSFFEPCKGVGNIYNEVDVPYKDYCELLENRDYLTAALNNRYDLIITNPPFTYAKEFVEKSLNEADSVWYLLRLNFLESKERYDWWQDKNPTHLLTLSARPSFTGKGTDATGYAWFGWDYNNTCKLQPGIHVLPYLKY